MAPKTTNFNFFRKIPEDLQLHTSSGTLFSIFSMIIMITLIIFEYQAYIQPMTKSIVSLDSHQEDRLRINFNVSLPSIPCHYASVDLSDHMGQYWMNITRHIRHYKLVDGLRQEEIIIDDHDHGIPVFGDIAIATKGKNVHYSTPLTMKNFQIFMEKYELVLVNYYAPWCPYCQMLAPEWESAAAQLQDHPEFAEKVRMASVDCTDDAAYPLCVRARVRAYPTMLIYVYGRTHTRFMYNGPRSAMHLLQFLDMFFRRLDPEADYAEETQINEETLGLPTFILQQMNIDRPIHHDDKNNNGNNPKPMDNPNAIVGCEVSGSVSVERVPGKFVLTARAKNQSFELSNVNVSHTVNHFSFGQMKRSEHLIDGEHEIRPNFVNARYPLDRKVFSVENKNITIEHFLNVVGYDREDERVSLRDITHRMYEFSASSNQYNATNALPAVLFTYDISPLVITIQMGSVPFYKFLTSLCAVVGGVFTIIGIVDSTVFYTLKSIQKKEQLGKLS